MGFFDKILDPFGMEEKLLGKPGERVTQPTTFQTLPKEAQDAFLASLARGEELSLDSSLFAPADLTGEQR